MNIHEAALYKLCCDSSYISDLLEDI